MPLLMSVVPRSLDRYVEPFAGSACLFFGLNPPRALLGDFNGDLMHAYSIVAREPRRLARAVRQMPPSPDYYYALRRVDPQSLDDFDRAARFVYLNRYCFNGVYRTNHEGQFNVPMGSRVGAMPSEEEFVRCSTALRRAELIPDDFGRTLSRVRAGDVVYVDPPYSSSSRSTFGEYGYGAFGPGDLSRLLHYLTIADERGAVVILSYRNDPEVVEYLENWSVVELRVNRQVGRHSSRLEAVVDILACNNLDLDRVHRGRFST